MIQYITGNLLESPAQALVNTVNTVGIMGKGIALQFKNQFPNNYKVYVNACKKNNFTIGQLLIEKDNSLLYGEKIIINFPTKTDWRKPSEYAYIEEGLIQLVKYIQANQIQSIAIPPLGAGNGGLVWAKVKTMLEQHLGALDTTIYIYQPNYIVQEILHKELVPLTPARAMLLMVLYDLVSQGEFVSEFAAEKICYFLQRFGAKDILKLDFKPNFYGPYSSKVKHVLYYLNGSYLRGYSGKDKKPFDILDLMTDTAPIVAQYLADKPVERKIATDTIAFLSNSYDSFSLELLSTLDFIIQTEKITDIAAIEERLKTWSERKSKLFTNNAFLVKGYEKIKAIPELAIQI